MASRNKKTTMAKLNREHRLQERRMAKQARKEARKRMTPEERAAADAADLEAAAKELAAMSEPGQA
jgi:hypothetical protein